MIIVDAFPVGLTPLWKLNMLLAITRYHAVTRESSVLLERLPSPSWLGKTLPRHRWCGQRSHSPAMHEVWVWPPITSWIPTLCRHILTLCDTKHHTNPNAHHHELLCIGYTRHTDLHLCVENQTALVSEWRLTCVTHAVLVRNKHGGDPCHHQH